LREFLGSKFAHIDTLLTSVGTGTDRIKSIHQAIRNYTRVDAEPVPGQAIGPIVDEAATILSSKLKTFDLDVDLGDLPGVTCRRSQLGQVFANLLSNAADALQEEKERRGEEGFEGKVVVRGMAVKHGGQMGVVVRVEDNGPGIPADIRDKIREAFFTTKAVGKGTGLGMSICQRIIDAHGGTLVVGDSVEFGGASMIIWLPLNLDQERVDS
jgi:signal transduction histidine kinase